MKLTKLQRHTAYIIFLEEAKRPKWSRRGCFGLCHLIHFTFGMTNEGYKEDSCLPPYNLILDLYFPELISKKPVDGWPDYDNKGWEWRREQLQKCIEETY